MYNIKDYTQRHFRNTKRRPPRFRTYRYRYQYVIIIVIWASGRAQRRDHRMNPVFSITCQCNDTRPTIISLVVRVAVFIGRVAVVLIAP